mmetsp:Transcript_4899/g.14514  ORF Transcript_4899/g.14514 Transcript_4899/m.14514 type:complete len:163 (+) Transcript_4899:250-738(+)
MWPALVTIYARAFDAVEASEAAPAAAAPPDPAAAALWCAVALCALGLPPRLLPLVAPLAAGPGALDAALCFLSSGVEPALRGAQYCAARPAASVAAVLLVRCCVGYLGPWRPPPAGPALAMRVARLERELARRPAPASCAIRPVCVAALPRRASRKRRLVQL